MASLLRKSFSETDLQARLGGDEFVVLTYVREGERASPARCLFADQIALRNAHADHRYTPEASIGVACAEPGPTLLEALIRSAG